MKTYSYDVVTEKTRTAILEALNVGFGDPVRAMGMLDLWTEITGASVVDDEFYTEMQRIIIKAMSADRSSISARVLKPV